MDNANLWKSFENNDISHSVAHYLMAIDELTVNQRLCHAANVARHLDVSRNAVSLKLQQLVKQALVELDEDRQIHLTEQGREAVANIVSARRAFFHFLTDFLGVNEATAEEDSCKVEHLLSAQTTQQLLRFAKYMQSNPKDSRALIDSFNAFNASCNPEDNGCDLCHHGCRMGDAT